jgi:hypothetical protein
MGLKSRLEHLEKLSEVLYRTLTLPDGQQIRCTHEEMMAAVIAAMHDQEHPLLPYIRRMDTKEGMPGLIRALEESHARGQV